MSEFDYEGFVSSVYSGEYDRKTLSGDSETRPCHNSSVSPTDFPPESYFLSKDAQLEWLSENALFERKYSQRGNSVDLSSNPNSNPSSQRFLLIKSKASIIGLPKPQKTCFEEVKLRRNGCRVDKNRLILKRFGSRIKTDTSLLEPSSPKVSCIGRVKSKRERNRSRQMHRQKSGWVNPVKEKVSKVKKFGFMARFRAIFRIRGCKSVSARGNHMPPSKTYDIRSRNSSEKVEISSFDGGEPAVAVPSLGRMAQFASGRRANFGGY